MKKKFDRKKVIIRLNVSYFCISIFITMVLGILIPDRGSIHNTLSPTLLLVLGYYPFSRCNEVFYSFLRDAIDKLDSSPSKTGLSPKERIRLSLRSYLELVINFAIIYFLLPDCFWKSNRGPKNIIESIYFSGVTITTLGYGDISPEKWLSQILTVYEVFCGFILLVVCFTIYTGLKESSRIESE